MDGEAHNCTICKNLSLNGTCVETCPEGYFEVLNQKKKN